MKHVKFNFARFGATLGLLAALVLPLLQTGSSAPSIATDRSAQKALSANAGDKALPRVVASVKPTLLQDMLTDRKLLSAADAKTYRALFAAVRSGDDDMIKNAPAKLENSGLLGVVLAERYSRAHCCVGYDQLRDWLKQYASLPQALTIYSRALALRQNDDSALQIPTTPNVIRGAIEDRTPGFTAVVPLDYDNVKLRKDDELLARNINRLIRNTQPTQAQKLLDAALSQRKLASALEGNARAAIAAGYFFAGVDDKVSAILNDTARQLPLAQWVAGLAAWRQQDHSGANKYFTALAAQNNISEWDRAAGSFWAYRARQKLGDSDGAKAMLVQAAEQPRSFYGLMAAHRLGRDKMLRWELPRFGAAQARILAHNDTGWRAMALLQVGENELAEAELRRLRAPNNRPLQEAMLALAHEAGMPALLIQLGGSMRPGEGKFYDAALFPLPPWQPTQGYLVDEALLYAVIRHESRFNPDARSHRGASGLMQLMPRTASVMAGSALDVKTEHLFDPVTNISLGQRYVGYLAAKPEIDNNLLLLLAAYNGGPSKLSRWLREIDHNNDPLLFIESLPVRETRDYVENVLTNYWVYRDRLDQSQSSLAALAGGEWPRSQFTLASSKKLKAASLVAPTTGTKLLASASR
jgi:soluble lytic murein transglycosylase